MLLVAVEKLATLTRCSLLLRTSNDNALDLFECAVEFDNICSLFCCFISVPTLLNYRLPLFDEG